MRIATWNMQGAKADNESSFPYLCSIINSKKIDVMCLQECGYLSGRFNWNKDMHFSDVYYDECNIGKIANPNIYTVLYTEWGDTNNRCSLAIMVNNNYINKYCYSLYIPGDNSTRPVLGIFVKLLNCGFYTVHCPSGNQNFAQKYIDSALNIMKKNINSGIFKNFVVAGDFNINATEYKEITGVNMFYPIDNRNKAKITQKSGDCLDYCVTNRQISPKSAEVENMQTYSDHNMVIFDF